MGFFHLAIVFLPVLILHMEFDKAFFDFLNGVCYARGINRNQISSREKAQLYTAFLDRRVIIRDKTEARGHKELEATGTDNYSTEGSEVKTSGLGEVEPKEQESAKPNKLKAVLDPVDIEQAKAFERIQELIAQHQSNFHMCPKSTVKRVNLFFITDKVKETPDYDGKLPGFPLVQGTPVLCLARLERQIQYLKSQTKNGGKEE